MFLFHFEVCMFKYFTVLLQFLCVNEYGNEFMNMLMIE